MQDALKSVNKYGVQRLSGRRPRGEFRVTEVADPTSQVLWLRISR